MPDHKSLVITPWLISALTLLASVLVAPIRTPDFARVSVRLDCTRRAFAPPPSQPTTSLSAVMATGAVFQVNALPSEDEEQDRADALDSPRFSFIMPWSFRKVADRQLITPRSILSLYHLRC